MNWLNNQPYWIQAMAFYSVLVLTAVLTSRLLTIIVKGL